MNLRATKKEILDLCHGDMTKACNVTGIDYYSWSQVPDSVEYDVEVRVIEDYDLSMRGIIAIEIVE